MTPFTDKTTGLEHVINDLLVWKFFTAKTRLQMHKIELPLDTQTCIDALVTTFGNSGHIEGSLEPIVCAAINHVVSSLEKLR